MFIPYENIGSILHKIFKNERLKEFFYNKKISQNLSYIKSNYPKVIKKLKNKKNLKVVFYIYDETKWKCQSLYDLFEKEGRFTPLVLVTRNAAKNPDNSSYQTIDDVKKCYEFFKNKKMNVELAYDVEHEKHIPFKGFSPDIIFYQHPWYVETSQGPVVCSEFALTYYVPYYFPIETANMDYGLRFHSYVETYCVLNEYLENKYKSLMSDNGENVKALGYPFLDEITCTSGGDYVIYAPHWTICGKGLAYSTFDWSGKYMLNYAKSHPESKWIFKPHPLLFNALITNKLMTKEEAENYYNEWGKIGLKYESGDYWELFQKSKMLITDCSSFLGEYFITHNPVIHLMSEKSQFRDSDNPILKTYYRVENLEELQNALEKLPLNDFMKEKRMEVYNQLDFKNSSIRIMDDIMVKLRN